jgi:CheY-like chemotaxis protein
VLLADDNPDAVERLGLILRSAGHDVRTAADGEEAVRVAKEFRPHVAFLDLGMPNADGYEAAKRIRAQAWGREIHLVALTGWGQEADKRRGKEAGFDAHFVKPVAPESLHRLLARICPLPESSSAS